MTSKPAQAPPAASISASTPSGHYDMLEGRHRRERRSRAREPRRRKTTVHTFCVHSVRNQSNHVMRRGVSFRRSSPAPARAVSWSYQCPTWSQRMRGAPRRCHSCPCSRRLGESGFSECESLTHGSVQSLNGFAATDKVWNPAGRGADARNGRKRTAMHRISDTRLTDYCFRPLATD